MVQELAYLTIEVADPEAWVGFAGEVIGLARAEGGPEEGSRWAWDGRPFRLELRPGSDDLAAVGWELAGPVQLERLADRLQAAGVRWTEDRARAADVGAEQLLRFTDPGGVPVELVCGMPRSPAPQLPMVPGGFVAGALGLGHVVIRSENREESELFYRSVMGFRLSDHIRCTYYDHPVDLAFLHCNPRHHSLAIGGRLPTRMHHMMVEMHSVDDVGAAYDRAVAAGVRIANTLGRHPNDRMLSFYAFTPSGLQIEVGTGGREIDDTSWEPEVYDRISDWGHHPPGVLHPRRRRKR